MDPDTEIAPPLGFVRESSPTFGASGGDVPPPEGFEPEQQPQYSSPPAGNRSLGGQLLTGTENAMFAGAQMSTPNVASYGAPLGRATVDELGYTHYIDPSGRPVYTDQSKHVVLQDPQGTYQVYSRSDQTNEGRLSALGHIIAPGLGASTLPAAGAVALPAAVQAGQQIGATVPRAVSNPFWRMIGQVSAKAPGGAPLRSAMEEGVADLGRATESGSEMLGGPASAQTAGAAFRSGQAAKFGQELPDTISGLYNEVDKFVDPNVRVPLDSTRSAVADIMARQQNAGIEGTPTAVQKVLASVQKPEGLNYEGVKDLRTVFREFKDRVPEGMSRQHVNAIYNALSDDLRASVQATGGAEGLAAFEKANTATRLAAQWEERIAKIIGTRSDEDVARTLQRMASSGAGADLKGLVAARAAVPQEAWQRVAANAIGGLGRNSHGEFSPALFLRDYSQLSDAGKRVLFHGAGSGDLIQHLDNIATVSQKFVAAAKLGNPSGTASHATHTATLIEGVGPLLSGDVVTPLKVLGGVLGNNALARFLSRPATAASTARWAQAYGRYVNNPRGPSLNTIDAATRQLSSSAVKSGAWGGSADDLNNHIQSAAMGQQEQPQ